MNHGDVECVSLVMLQTFAMIQLLLQVAVWTAAASGKCGRHLCFVT